MPPQPLRLIACLTFSAASLPLTYLLHFFFISEMSALTWMLGGYFTWSFLTVTTNLMLQVRGSGGG